MNKYKIAVAYYPEHRPESTWQDDLRLMKSHGFEMVRVLEFAWSRMEPKEGRYDFRWVHRFMKLATQEGVQVVPCTPTAAPPAWLTHHYPETLAMDPQGHRAHHGARRHYCPASKTYRNFCRRIARKMQKELGGYANVAAWQIDNELGFNRTFSSEADARFRQTMKKKYGTLAKLNEAWGGAFWSVDFSEWEQVVVPRANSPEGASHLSPEMSLESCRFYSDLMVDFAREQKEALRAAGCKVPISTNIAGMHFDHIDHWSLTEEMDFVGFDIYPFTTTLQASAMAHDFARSVKKGLPHWTFENGVETPPGSEVPTALAALARGQVCHTIFRWDSCPFGHEMDLQGILKWSGKPRAKLREIRHVRQVYDAVQSLDLPPVSAPVAIVFSFDNYWTAARYYGNYWSEVMAYYDALFALGISADILKPGDDMSRYAVVLAPGLMILSDDELEAFRQYVREGGVLVAGRKSFSKLPSASYRRCDHPALTDVFGMCVDETMTDRDYNSLDHSLFTGPFPNISWKVTGTKGMPASRTHGWHESLELAGAEVLYSYAEGWFEGCPLATHNHYGKGTAYYMGSMLDSQATAQFIRHALDEAEVGPLVHMPHGIQLVRRDKCWFITNHTPHPTTLKLPCDARTILGTKVSRRSLELPGWGYAIVEVKTA